MNKTNKYRYFNDARPSCNEVFQGVFIIDVNRNLGRRIWQKPGTETLVSWNLQEMEQLHVVEVTRKEAELLLGFRLTPKHYKYVQASY